MTVEEYLKKPMSYGNTGSFPEAIDTPYLLTLKIMDYVGVPKVFVHIKRVTFGEKNQFRCYALETTYLKNDVSGMKEALASVVSGMGLRICQELYSYPTCKVIIDTTYDQDLNYIIPEEKVTEEEMVEYRHSDKMYYKEMCEDPRTGRSYKKRQPKKKKLSEDDRELFLRIALLKRAEIFVETKSE
jgi:hypothetical protein